MTERLLQYIWQFCHFNLNDLRTDEGDLLQVIHPGSLNTNQGPDFIDAKIKIASTTWAGSIELHTQASHWKDHKHSGDKNYNNVILHVVWKNDVKLHLPFSTLVLEDKVPKLLLHRYDELMNAGSFIPCEKNIHLVNSLTWQSLKESMLVERLESKTRNIFDQLQKTNYHWEEICWWQLAKNFGIKLNAVAFEKVARSLPLHILAKHRGQIHQAEALLFGQAGLLDGEFTGDYPKLLQREYLFLKKKYGLQKVEAGMFFLRMRPSNFPTLRLAQLAMLLHKSQQLFSKIKESQDVNNIRGLLRVTANDYWHYHYVFDVPSPFKKKKLGEQMIGNILVNTVVPVVFAYGHYHHEQVYKDKALHWLEHIKAEQNAITRGFTTLGANNKTAFDSQALIQLKNEYCNKKRCLDCSIGNKLIRKAPS